MLARGHDLTRQNTTENRLRGSAGERWLAREHLVQHAADRVHVARGIRIPIRRRLLGAHVIRGAEAQTRFREAPATRLLHRQRDPEVRHHRLPVVQQNVRRLDVAVDYVVPVRVVERAGDGAGDGDGLIDGQLLLPFDAAL